MTSVLPWYSSREVQLVAVVDVGDCSQAPPIMASDSSESDDDNVTNYQAQLESKEEFPPEKISWNFYAPRIVSNPSLLKKLKHQLTKRYATGTGDVFASSTTADVLTVMMDDPPLYTAEQVLATIQKLDGHASFQG